MGSITVCKIVVDGYGHVVNGAGRAGASFAISGLAPIITPSTGLPDGVLPTTTWNAPIAFNSDVLRGYPGVDSNCVKYSGLVIGGNGYYYGRESPLGTGWSPARYNDQFTKQVNGLDDFFNYDGRLFDGDRRNDGARNLNADGHITLTNSRPDRTLVVLNQYTAAHW